MKLVEYDNYQIKVSDEAYLVEPIRRMLLKDKSKNKEDFFKKMSYMFFMYDPLSNYAYITDEKERSEMVIRQEGLPKWFKPDKDLKDAIEAYISLSETASTSVLKATMAACDKIRRFLEMFDPAQTDDKGRFLLDIDKFVKATSNIADLAKKLTATEKMVRQERLEERRLRKGGTRSIMDMMD